MDGHDSVILRDQHQRNYTLHPDVYHKPSVVSLDMFLSVPIVKITVKIWSTKVVK